ncbi:MAG: hypothetical protein AAGH17_07450 [Pseudomonadota bacterium]
MNDPVLAHLHPSPGRRIFAAGVLGLLGVLLVWMAVSTPANVGLRAFLALAGLGALYVMQWLWRATSTGVELTRAELREIGGPVIVRVDQLSGVERGPFAFKPSNGFLLRLHEKQPRAWVPGLWWRLGRSVGIGGVTSGHEGKAMAEAIQMLITRSE